MGGRISVESVVRCSWNGWPDDRGIRTFHFHFHRLARGDLVSGVYGLGDAAAGGDVVFLDLEGVECLCVGGAVWRIREMKSP